MFAFDTATGALYESTGSTTALIGTPGAWSKPITVSWGTATLASADVNNQGNLELWVLSGSNDTTATGYQLTGTTLTKEGTGSSLAAPADDWPLDDGSPLAQGSTTSTATDTITGDTATLNGGAAWTDDNYFGETIATDGTSGYLTPPAGTIPTTDATPTISVWFRTTTAGGVIASLQSTTLTPGGTSGTYDPILYVGTDGYLYAQWYTGRVAPLISNSTSHPVIVDDGLWHHAVLATTGSGSGTTQTLTVDGYPEGSLTGALSLQGDTHGNTNLTFGAGYIGGNWPAEPNYKATSQPDYLQGQIADITYTH